MWIVYDYIVGSSGYFFMLGVLWIATNLNTIQLGRGTLFLSCCCLHSFIPYLLDKYLPMSGAVLTVQVEEKDK